jgi:hypothetical protein
MERITYSRNWESQMKNEAILRLPATGMKIAVRAGFRDVAAAANGSGPWRSPAPTISAASRVI